MIRQFIILSKRNIRILARDRISLLLMVGIAPLVALLDFVLALVLGPNLFDWMEGNVFFGLIVLFMGPLYGVMVGGLAMMREIVKEAEIYRRERLVNLKILPYVLSKIWIAVLLALFHAAAYTIVRYLAFNMPGGALEFVLIYVSMFFTTLAGMMIGLFASALAPNSNTAPLLLIMFILPQVVLGGALVPVPTFVSAPTATRWGFEALMATTGVGSDVAADICWSPELADARTTLSLEEKDALDCRCLGTNVLDPDSCNFPGLGIYYNPAVDEPPPVEPPPLREQPPEPELPPRPEEPEDQSDTVAVAEYLDDLEVWEAQVTEIQDNYRAEIDAYTAEAEVYQAQVIDYQTSLADWQVARAAAVQPAEGLVAQLNRDMGWTFVNKEDLPAFIGKIVTTWVAEMVIITLAFVGIMILQKRKDVI